MNISKALVLAALTLSPALCFGQQFTSSSAPEAPSAAKPIPVKSTLSTKVTAPLPGWESSLDRWLDLNSLTYASRYRSTFDDDGARSFNQGQQRIIANGKFKFDKEGRYGIGFHLSSGRYFNWAYADFIGGGQHQFINNVEAKMSPYQLYLMEIVAPYQDGFFRSGGGQVYLRQAFLSAEPVPGITAEFGGIGINHGVNSEATSYDDDGYMSGERLTIKRPKQLWLSEISYTRGYLGDLYTPNFFARGQRLSRSNYWQVLGRKDFGKRIAVSTDYTYSAPEAAPFVLKTIREAILADVHESKLFDKVRFESYQRINQGEYAPGIAWFDGKGYALTVSRDLKKRLSLEAGFANIDPDYINNLGLNVQALVLGLAVNGDQYGVGKRYFVRPTIPLTKAISFTGVYSHTYDDAETRAHSLDVWNAQNLTAGFVFDVKKALFHEPRTK